MNAWINGLREAAAGWAEWNTAGKLTVLFLAALLFLFFTNFIKKESPLTTLLWHAVIGAGLCICPVTAMLLMRYQTRFYGYAWIWGCVPFAIVTAYGGVCFLRRIFEEQKSAATQRPGLWNFCRKAISCLLFAAVLALCGSWEMPAWRADAKDAERLRVQRVLETAREVTGGGEICLWAPQAVMEYARARDGEIRLLYGRDMWDGALGAYTYETYSEEKTALYHWMEAAADAEPRMKGEEWVDMLESAGQQGVNCVLLPDTLDGETLETLEKAAGWQSRTVEGYFLFFREENR